METKELLRLCGIDGYRVSPVKESWLKARLKFIGEESYILGTKSCEVSLTGTDGGFCLRFKEPVVFMADQLLGNQAQQGRLMDSVIEFPDDSTLPELSLASLTQGLYPIVLRKQGKVTIS